jgi:hypothetical protein
MVSLSPPGLSSYSIIHNPKYKSMFALSERFVRSHKHLRAVHALRSPMAGSRRRLRGSGDMVPGTEADDDGYDDVSMFRVYVYSVHDVYVYIYVCCMLIWMDGFMISIMPYSNHHAMYLFICMCIFICICIYSCLTCAAWRCVLRSSERVVVSMAVVVVLAEGLVLVA